MKKTSKEVDEKLERAIEVLSHYETEYHPNKPVSCDGRSLTVLERMATAKAKEKRSSTIWNAFKEKLSLRVRFCVYNTSRNDTNNHRKATKEEQPEPTTVVEFLLLKSLPDKCPTIVKRECRVCDPNMLFSSLTLSRQRCLVQHRIYKKFFGISAASRTNGGSLSNRTLISTNNQISLHR